ncbi:Asp23/Gls24 family envelope stress response protein [Corynebacterium guangdongense]|uniref:Alkaline shock family protein YloU n=1 Tax=Corynebacterium guangdongense TaxID=1783348 RepID=A0ABU1ZU96_9CORY|nr:Asp23/Gls24 family envelope stress response protein [Corynebacterium guangdongense]MDR7328502.1 putative alkaline shock family protein YloU [Corynebacterium guangdongense]WJZ17079.1 hypothetical protein CGUA_02415 [Corynebacterium guangdongense]
MVENTETPVPNDTPSGTRDTGAGRTVIEDIVVGKIAGLAAREVSGVYALGGGAARVMGSLRGTFVGSENVQQGVNVEVGEKQAAVDLSIVAEYGVAIHELAEAIRANIIRSIERMTGLEVTEVNVTVTDIHLHQEQDDALARQQAPLPDDQPETPAARVQ